MVSSRPKLIQLAIQESICWYGIIYILYHNVICLISYMYYNSLVGRDFKTWVQIGVFIVWPELTPSEKKMWLFAISECKKFLRNKNMK